MRLLEEEVVFFFFFSFELALRKPNLYKLGLVKACAMQG